MSDLPVLLARLQPRILTIRKRRVMLDAQLAELYGVTPKRLREQVRRNRERFPDDFMFQLTAEEAEAVVPQNAAPSPRAVRANIQIMRAFVYAKTRERWRSTAWLGWKSWSKFLGHDQDIERIFSTLRDLLDPAEEPRRKIGFEPGSKF